MKSLSYLAVALETIGVIGIIAGIAVEATMQADIGFIFITGGSGLIAAGALIWGKLIKKR